MPNLPCRNDALVKVMNGVGYNPILLPRTGIEPPFIYTYENKELKPWGRLTTAVPAGSLPSQLNGGVQNDISFTQSSRMTLEAAGNFLEDALRCIGVNSAPKLDLNFARGSQITFSFSSVTWRGLDPADVAIALNKGFDPVGLDESKVRLGMVHVAYDYAYADEIEMTLTQDVSDNIDLKAIKIDTFIDLGGKAEYKVKTSKTLTFKSKGDPAAFACKVGQVKPARQGWTFNATEIVGRNFAPEEGPPAPYLLSRGQVLVVADDSSPA